jgi:hypothetical protein
VVDTSPPGRSRSCFQKKFAQPSDQCANSALIGIGGRLTAPPLPHHLAYGSRTGAVRRVELQRAHRVEADRESRRRGYAVPFEPSGVLTFARTPSVNRPRPQQGTSERLYDVVPGSGSSRSATAAKDTCAVFGGSTLPGGRARVGFDRSRSSCAIQSSMVSAPRRLVARISPASGESCSGSAPGMWREPSAQCAARSRHSRC